MISIVCAYKHHTHTHTPHTHKHIYPDYNQRMRGHRLEKEWERHEKHGRKEEGNVANTEFIV